MFVSFLSNKSDVLVGKHKSITIVPTFEDMMAKKALEN